MSEAVTETTASTTQDVPALITVDLDERAVLARVNRALAKEHKNLRKCRRDTTAYRKLGEYYLVTLEPAVQIVETRVDLDELARKLGVLEAFEKIAVTEGAA